MSDSDRPASDGELEEIPVSLSDRELEDQSQADRALGESPMSDGELEDRPESEIDRTDSEKTLEDYGVVSDFDEDAPFVRPEPNFAIWEDELTRDATTEDSDEDGVPVKKMKLLRSSGRNRYRTSSSSSPVVEKERRPKKKAKPFPPGLSGKAKTEAEALYNEQVKSGKLRGRWFDDPSISERQCQECLMICGSPGKLEKHMQTLHKNSKKIDTTCPLCKKDILYAYNLPNHIVACRPKSRANFINDIVKKNYPDFLKSCKDIVNNPEAEIALPEGYEMDEYGFITAVDVKLDIDEKRWFEMYGPEDKKEDWRAPASTQDPAANHNLDVKYASKLNQYYNQKKDDQEDEPFEFELEDDE